MMTWACVSPSAADFAQANAGQPRPAGKLSPQGTAKQVLFELSQFVLPCKMYVTRHSGGLTNLKRVL